MKYTYEEINSSIIKATDKNGLELFIPTDPANADYQAYLASLQAPTATPQA